MAYREEQTDLSHITIWKLKTHIYFSSFWRFWLALDTFKRRRAIYVFPPVGLIFLHLQRITSATKSSCKIAQDWHIFSFIAVLSLILTVLNRIADLLDCGTLFEVCAHIPFQSINIFQVQIHQSVMLNTWFMLLKNTSGGGEHSNTRGILEKTGWPSVK